MTSSTPVPHFLAVPADEHLRLMSSPQRVDRTLELLDAAEHPTLRLGTDLTWVGLQAGLNNTPAAPALSGGEMWRHHPPVHALADMQVTMLADALADTDPATVEETGGLVLEESFGEVSDGDIAAAVTRLTEFFRAAADRGDAVIIAFV